MVLESIRWAKSISMLPESVRLQTTSSSRGQKSLCTCIDSARAFVWRSRSRLARSRSLRKYSPPTEAGRSGTASSTVPSLTTILTCISDLPRNRDTLSRKVLRLARTARRRASSDVCVGLVCVFGGCGGVLRGGGGGVEAELV